MRLSSTVIYLLGVISMLPLHSFAQTNGGDQLDKNHWFYQELKKGEFFDAMRLFSAPNNGMFPDSLFVPPFSKASDLGYLNLENNEVQNLLKDTYSLKRSAFFLEIMGEKSILHDTIETVRIFDGHKAYTTRLLNDSCIISIKYMDSDSLIHLTASVPKIDFEYLKKRLKQVSFSDTPTFASPDLQEFGAAIGGSVFGSTIESQLNGQYHLVAMSSMEYVPDFNRIKLWFIGNTRHLSYPK